jgi:L-fuconolactonase
VDYKIEALQSLSKFLTVDDRWLAQYHEPITDPELPIIDPHHHLWGSPRQPYLIPQFCADLESGQNVLATIYVECHENYRADGPEEQRPVGETEFVAAEAQRFHQSNPEGPRICAGIIGHADLTAGAAVQDILEAHMRVGQGRFRGIRQSTAWDPHEAVRTTIRTVPEGLLRYARLREGFARLAPLGLTFDCWVYHPQLADVADLARAFPGTTIVLDHAGGPIGISEYAHKPTEVMRVWKRGILEVAKCPNVRIKIGGLGMRLGGFGFQDRSMPPSSEDLSNAWKPFVHTCIEAFGTQRAMFESNFPADKPSCSYLVLWNAFKRLASGCSAQEKADLFSQTAIRTYSI